MRERDRDRGRIDDIIEASNNILEFLEGVDYESFIKNKVLYFAIVKNVDEIAGRGRQ